MFNTTLSLNHNGFLGETFKAKIGRLIDTTITFIVHFLENCDFCQFVQKIDF